MSLQQKVEEVFEDQGNSNPEVQLNYYDLSLSSQLKVGDDQSIESNNVDTSKSFEVFQGKLFQEYSTVGSCYSANSLKSRLSHFFEEYGVLKNELDSLSKSSSLKPLEGGSVWADIQAIAKQHIEEIECLLSKTNIQVRNEYLLCYFIHTYINYYNLIYREPRNHRRN